MGPNTYKIDIPTHPDKIATVNVVRLKPFRGYCSRPFNDNIPEDDSPIYELTVDCLPESSFTSRVTFGGNDVAYTATDSPIFRLVDKRRTSQSGEPEYLVEYVDGHKHWIRASKPQEYRTYFDSYENERRMSQGLPPYGVPVATPEAELHGVDSVNHLMSLSP
ncbi:hypothetical protein H310_07409 [Aphanomyces invadans]|uniref:Chromo domain-containing protein n=1 Tax=Aphanomyces invadans TaxID=157072 RepID=A0A024U181_9STRA|nr:hypothetical protein H310_07409 [Aphanomyces invadans]ETV99954.1 hypothetical protein H310_07409 [Aphanomyces invadans]|eukprot:XP_008871372.1 hypothetical protein H310_07409 [Aphanomyces invadans]